MTASLCGKVMVRRSCRQAELRPPCGKGALSCFRWSHCLDVVEHVVVPAATPMPCSPSPSPPHGRRPAGQQQVEEGGAVAGIVALAAEGESLDLGQALLDHGLVGALALQHVGSLRVWGTPTAACSLPMRKLAPYRQLPHAPVVADVVVPVVGELLGGVPELLVVRDDHAPSPARWRSEEVVAVAAYAGPQRPSGLPL